MNFSLKKSFYPIISAPSTELILHLWLWIRPLIWDDRVDRKCARIIIGNANSAQNLWWMSSENSFMHLKTQCFKTYNNYGTCKILSNVIEGINIFFKKLMKIRISSIPDSVTLLFKSNLMIRWKLLANVSFYDP